MYYKIHYCFIWCIYLRPPDTDYAYLDLDEGASGQVSDTAGGGEGAGEPAQPAIDYNDDDIEAIITRELKSALTDGQDVPQPPPSSSAAEPCEAEV